MTCNPVHAKIVCMGTFSKEQKESWPKGHKGCKTCLEVKALSEFHKHNTGYLGVSNECKPCRHIRSKEQYAEQSQEQKMWNSAKWRANKGELEFDIDIEDIKIPDRCPVLGIELEPGGENQDNSPSLDRMDPSKGYVKGNVKVISYRANMIKSNATSDEIEAVLAYTISCGV